MANTGFLPFRTVATLAGGGIPWTDGDGNPLTGDEVDANDDDFAAVMEEDEGVSNVLLCTNADLASFLPAGATVTAFTPRIRRLQSMLASIDVAGVSLRPYIGGVASGTPLVVPGAWTTTETAETFSSSMYGSAPTYAQVVASTFGFGFTLTFATGTTMNLTPQHFIDLFEIDVTYTPAAVASPKGGRMLLGVGIGI